jgi:hypothetical protein
MWVSDDDLEGGPDNFATQERNRNVVTNWRQISMKACICHIFTCLMARFFHEMNKRNNIFSDSQKGFVKKTNRCSEHGIVLNEHLHDARRQPKNVIVAMIDFTNAFGTVPRKHIMSTMRQLNFLEWTRNITANMCSGATSAIELKRSRSDRTGWKKGAKQRWPLSPLRFKHMLATIDGRLICFPSE